MLTSAKIAQIFLLAVLATSPLVIIAVQPAYAQSAAQNQSAGNDITIGEELKDVTRNATQAAQSISSELAERLQRIEIPDATNLPDINFPDLDLDSADTSLLANLYNQDPDLEQAPFPPAIVGGQIDAPEYTIDIPHTSTAEDSTYEPAEIGIPVGTTIMWINKDSAPHTVTTVEQGREGSPPESFDSGSIPGKRSGLYEVTPFGGSFIHTFNTPGVYEYFCTIHPGHTGRIVVGDTIQLGQQGKLVLVEGANLPFNSSKLSRVLLAVVPSTDVIDLPPTTAVTYSVSISGPAPQNDTTATNQTAAGPTNNPKEVIYESREFVDTDGVLHLELVPQPQVNGTNTGFVTWGPDISGTATGPHTGAFHIKGPVMVQNEPYTLKVSITNIDDEILDEPITEEFILSPNLASPQPE